MPTELFFQTRTSQIYGGTISLIVLAILAVALRLYARSITRAKLWWDDWILVLALVKNKSPSRALDETDDALVL